MPAQSEKLANETDRRRHQRLRIRLPVEFRKCDGGSASVLRTITQNVSTGGVYVELDSPEFQLGDRVEVELTVPPAEGVSPYPGRASCPAEVLRIQSLDADEQGGFKRFGIAARFLDRLRLAYDV